MTKIIIDPKYYINGSWHTQAVLKTIGHEHYSIYDSVHNGAKRSCDIMLVETEYGKFFIEDSWGGETKDEPKVFDTKCKDTNIIYLFDNKLEAHLEVVAVLHRQTGLSLEELSRIFDLTEV